MSTSKNELIASLAQRLAPGPNYCIAYSGGVDSHVLLHAMCALRDRLSGRVCAVHVDHSLQEQSVEWTRHCERVCRSLGVPLSLLRVDARARPGESPEARARELRYRALADWLPPGAVLLTAHHRDDQAETLLLQLFRGAGAQGLAAMPEVAPLGRGRLARPFLDLARALILRYAHEQHLQWIDDPSNQDTRYDRNLLRHRLLPVIRQRWHGIDAVLARSARLQAEQSQLAAALARIDLDQCAVAGQAAQLYAPAFVRLARARQANLLRHWIAANRLPPPSAAVVEQVIDCLLGARRDAMPLVGWSGAQVRRHDDRLYLMRPLVSPNPDWRRVWDLRAPLLLPTGDRLCALPVHGRGLRVPPQGSLEVGFRQGGEVLRPAGRRGHHRLKKLFQEWRVPHWQRGCVPLLFCDGALAAVGEFCVAEGYQAGQEEKGI